MGMQPPRATQPMVQQSTYQKQKRKGLSIIDPVSGKDILTNIYQDNSGAEGSASAVAGAQSSEASSSRGTSHTVSTVMILN